MVTPGNDISADLVCTTDPVVMGASTLSPGGPTAGSVKANA